MFAPGTRVRVRAVDPDHHTRLPRYLRGQIGEVVVAAPPQRLPDDLDRELPQVRVEPVYAVRFHGSDLWGSGSHTVTADLWESYLEDVQ
jgi:nitrile hydratase